MRSHSARRLKAEGRSSYPNISPDYQKRRTRSEGNSGCESRHVFITFNFVSLLMKPGFVSLDACSILPASERITDLPGKVVDFERFLDKMHPFLQHAVMNDDI